MANVPSSRTIGSVSSTYYNSGTNEDVDFTITFYLITSYTQSAANNTTTVSMHVRAVPSPSVPYMVGSWSITGTGGTKSGGETSFASGTKNFSSSSKTLTHTTSGTCSFSSGATLNVAYYTTIPGSKVNKSLFKTLTLSNKSYSVPSFNVYSTLSFNTTSPTMLNNCVMTISKAAVATSGVRIKATYDGADHTIYTGSANSYTWTVPDLHLTTPNSTKKAITITIQSVKGSTYYAAKTYTINAVVPATYVPDVRISNITDNIGWSQFVAGWSMLSVEMQGGTSDTVTTISSYALEVRQDDSSGNLIYNSSKSSDELVETLTMNTPIVSPTTWLKATITDSRGRKGTAEQTVTAVNYQQPQIALSTSRCDSLGNLDPIGNYILVQVEWSITQVGSDNFVTSNLITQLSTNGGSFVTVDSRAVSGYSGTYTFITALGAQYGGQLQASLSDNLTTTISNIKNVSRASIPLSLYDDGVDLGVTMGGIANAGGLEVRMPSKFQINGAMGNTLSDYVEEAGTENSWIYIKWASGKSECFYNHQVSVTSASWTTWGSSGLYYANDSAPPSFPNDLFIDRPAVFIAVTPTVDTNSIFIAALKGETSTTECSEGRIIGGATSTNTLIFSYHAVGRFK